MLKFKKEFDIIYFSDIGQVYSDFHRKKAEAIDYSVYFTEGYDGLSITRKEDLKRLINWLQDVYDNCEDV